MRVAEIQKIGQLVVVLISLARRGNDDHPPRGVCLHDGLYLFKLCGVGH